MKKSDAEKRVRPELRHVMSIDLMPPDDLPPVDAAFWIPVSAYIGQSGTDGEDIFTLYVCGSERWKAVTLAGDELPKHVLVLERFDWDVVRAHISSWCEAADASTWEECAQALGAHMEWEFEDYRERAAPPRFTTTKPQMTSAFSLEDLWRAAALELGLDLVVPFRLVLPSGAEVSARVLVKGFGAKEGMLILSRYDDVRSSVKELAKEGYGFSVMSDPGPGEQFVRQDIVEVLRDWGWSGPPTDAASWLKDG